MKTQKTTAKTNGKNSSSPHPDHSANLNRVRRIKGQLEGVERMIEGRRYCPDILTQIQAASSAMRSLALTILDSHLHHCVKDAMEAKNEQEKQKKLEELLEIFRRHT